MPLCNLPSDWPIGKRVVFKNAKRLIPAYGLDFITMEDIAKGYKEGERLPCKMSGTVSKDSARAFFSKDELNQFIQDLAWETILSKIKDIESHQCSSKEKLISLAKELPALMEEDLEATATLIRERYPTKQVEGEDHLQGCAQATQAIAIFERLLADTIKSESNEKAEKNNIRARAHVFYGAIEHGMLHAYVLYASSYDSKVRGMLRAHEFVIELEDVLVKLLNNLTS